MVQVKALLNSRATAPALPANNFVSKITHYQRIDRQECLSYIGRSHADTIIQDVGQEGRCLLRWSIKLAR